MGQALDNSSNVLVASGSAVSMLGGLGRVLTLVATRK